MVIADQIAGEHGEIGLHGISHRNGAPNLGARHEGADVDITELDDAQAIETGGQMYPGDLDGGEAISSPSSGGAIRRGQQGKAARQIRGGAEEGAARRLKPLALRRGEGRYEGAPEPHEDLHRDHSRAPPE